MTWSPQAADRRFPDAALPPLEQPGVASDDRIVAPSPDLHPLRMSIGIALRTPVLLPPPLLTFARRDVSTSACLVF